jgi:hypothetical protein
VREWNASTRPEQTVARQVGALREEVAAMAHGLEVLVAQVTSNTNRLDALEAEHEDQEPAIRWAGQ